MIAIPIPHCNVRGSLFWLGEEEENNQNTYIVQDRQLHEPTEHGNSWPTPWHRQAIVQWAHTLPGLFQRHVRSLCPVKLWDQLPREHCSGRTTHWSKTHLPVAF
jgi:hypothetical protein